MKSTSTFTQRLLWAAVLLFVYYTTGCVVFITLEREAELESYADNRELYAQMKELYAFEHCDDPAFSTLSFCEEQRQFSDSLRQYFNRHGNSSMEDLGQWTLVGTFFFLTQLATTIGYGGLHPRTPWGQLATIVFALVGIPIMGYTLVQVARLVFWLTALFLLRVCGIRVATPRSQMLVLWSLLLVLLFGGAFVYTLLEPWSYFEALYFCFATLSTVGFGDHLPSCALSKAFSVLYMIFGLGICGLSISVLTGQVAEGHDNLDHFVTEKVKAHCPAECCAGARHEVEFEGGAERQA